MRIPFLLSCPAFLSRSKTPNRTTPFSGASATTALLRAKTPSLAWLLANRWGGDEPPGLGRNSRKPQQVNHFAGEEQFARRGIDLSEGSTHTRPTSNDRDEEKEQLNEWIYGQRYSACDTKNRAGSNKSGSPANDGSAGYALDRGQLLCRLRPPGRHEVSHGQTAFHGSRKSSGRHAELGVTRLDCRAVAHHVHCR